jgi:hypothetical protein
MKVPFFSKKKDDESQNASTGDSSFLGRTEHFEWHSEAGNDSVDGFQWIMRDGVPYLEKVYSVYKTDVLQLGDANRIPIQVKVRPSSQCGGGIAGVTGNGELGYCAGTWGANQFCYGIIAHELGNLFTGEKVTAGWPTEWWANHRSPFPTVVANQAMRAVVPQFYRMWGNYNDPLVVMFDRLYNDFHGMFPRMFQKMRELNVSLSGLQDPYLSHTVYYFMFYGAGRQITNHFVSPPMPPINPSLIQEMERRYRLSVI